jgi:hypothetical protein
MRQHDTEASNRVCERDRKQSDLVLLRTLEASRPRRIPATLESAVRRREANSLRVLAPPAGLEPATR